MFNQKTHCLMVLVVYIYIYKLYTYISHPLSYHKFRKICRQTLALSAISSQVLFAIALQRGHLAGRHRPTIAEVRWVWGVLKKIGRNHPHRIKPSWFWQTMECIGSFCMVDWGMFCYIIVGFLVRINVVNMLVY